MEAPKWWEILEFPITCQANDIKEVLLGRQPKDINLLFNSFLSFFKNFCTNHRQECMGEIVAANWHLVVVKSPLYLVISLMSNTCHSGGEPRYSELGFQSQGSFVSWFVLTKAHLIIVNDFNRSLALSLWLLTLAEGNLAKARKLKL